DEARGHLERHQVITNSAQGAGHRARASAPWPLLFARCSLLVVWIFAAPARAATDLPQLTGPVNDFAHVIDPQSAAGIERLSRSLKAASGDVVVVATVPTIEPYGDIQEYATKLFENGGRGIGEKGKDNGVLILLALKERKVRIEVGYGLEEFITDRFAGETSREVMAPEFRRGAYGTGLLAGHARVGGRIAKAKNLKLDVQLPQEDEPEERSSSFPLWLPLAIFIAILIISRIGGGGIGPLFWGGGPWSGWSSGVGPFGGGGGICGGGGGGGGVGGGCWGGGGGGGGGGGAGGGGGGGWRRRAGGRGAAARALR